MPSFKFSEPVRLPYTNAQVAKIINGYYLRLSRVHCDERYYDNTYPDTNIFPRNEVIGQVFDHHMYDGVVLQQPESIIDFRIEFDYIHTDYFTYGNICVPKITAVVVPSSETDIEPDYEASEWGHWDPSAQFHQAVYDIGDVFELYDTTIGLNDELNGINVGVSAGASFALFGNAYWILRDIQTDGTRTTYTFTPDIDLSLNVYTQLKNSSFSTVSELYSELETIIISNSRLYHWMSEYYGWTLSNIEHIPLFGGQGWLNPSFPDFHIDKSFLKRSTTVGDVLKYIGLLYSQNITNISACDYGYVGSRDKLCLFVLFDGGDMYNMRYDEYTPAPIDTLLAWNTIQGDEDSIDATYSIAPYKAPYVNGVIVGDVERTYSSYPQWFTPPEPNYLVDINSSLFDSIDPSELDFDSEDNAYVPLTLGNYVPSYWEGYSFSIKYNTYYRPMSIHMSTFDYLVGNRKTRVGGHTKSFFINTIMNRFGAVAILRDNSVTEYYLDRTCQCFRLNAIVDGISETTHYGFISKLNFDFYNGVTIECVSTETRPQGDDWEGRPFITDITTIIDGEEVSLYPDHVYGWKIRGVNCPTEDYSIGNTSAYYEMTFDCDIKLPVGQRGFVIGDDSFIFEVVGVERKTRTKNQYIETCIITVNEIDEVIPDSSLTPVANETLDQLSYRLLGVHLPSLAVNKDYVIDKDWAYSGITKRQLAQWIYQLSGLNYCGYGQDEDIVGNERSYFAPTICPTYVRHAFHFYENDTKSIDKADYLTPQIDKIWFTNDNTNSGFSYGTGTQQLTIPYNPLINTSDTSFIQPLFNKVNSLVEYTPMKIETFLGKITLSELIRIYNGNDTGTSGRERMTWMMYYDPEADEAYYCPIFNWEASDTGIVLQGTGSKDRRVSNTYLDYDTQQTGRYAKISNAASSAASEAGQVSGDVSALASRVSECEDDIAQNALDIQSKVSSTDYNGNTIISKINANGVTQTINASRVDLSGYMQESSFTGTNIIDAINSTSTVGLIDADRVDLSGYTPPIPSLDGDALISRINANGVTSTISADRVDLSDYVESSDLATVATSGSYNDLTDAPTIPAAQIQSDWNQSITTSVDFIKNKPTNVSAFTNDVGYLVDADLDLDGDGIISKINAVGVTSLIDSSRIEPTDISGNTVITCSGQSEPHEAYIQSLSFTIPAGRRFCVEVQTYKPDDVIGICPQALVITDAMIDAQTFSKESIIKYESQWYKSDRVSVSLIGKPSTTTTYYVWSDNSYQSNTVKIGQSYTGWYM